MKSGQLFWGFLLLCVGALFLLVRYDVIVNDFGFVWDLWPLVFILWGALVIFKSGIARSVLSSVFGLFLGLMIFGILHNIFTTSDWSDDEKGMRFDSYVEDYDPGIQQAEFDFKSGGGIFIIKGTTQKLFDGESYGNLADYDFSTYQTDSMAYLDMRYEKKHFNIFRGKMRNRVEISLNEDPVWFFRFDFGAAKANFDLSKYKVRKVNLNTGAANVWLKLGDNYDRTYVDVNMGAAGLNIEIPEESGCRIHGDMVLFAKDLHGFTKMGSDDYETDNYQYAQNKIDIKIDGGVSSLSVSRY